MDILNQLFNNIANILLIPVMAVLLFFLLQALFRMGQFFQKRAQRKVYQTKWGQILKTDSQDELEQLFRELFKNRRDFQLASQLLVQNNIGSIQEKRAFHEFELAQESRLKPLKNLLKLGPMLGLMGTLIPMGPALTGLATGDVASMTTHLQVAFSTTVVGVFVSAIGYLLYSFERKWVHQDLFILEYYSEFHGH